MYGDYYNRQALHRGGGLVDIPYFAGARYQRGHGIGSIFSSIFRGLRSIFPGVLKTVGKHALKTGVNIAGDVLEGRRFQDSIKDHGVQGLKAAAGDVVPQVMETIKQSVKDGQAQSGSGRRKRKHRFSSDFTHSSSKRSRCSNFKSKRSNKKKTNKRKKRSQKGKGFDIFD